MMTKIRFKSKTSNTFKCRRVDVMAPLLKKLANLWPTMTMFLQMRPEEKKKQDLRSKWAELERKRSQLAKKKQARLLQPVKTIARRLRVWELLSQAEGLAVSTRMTSNL